MFELEELAATGAIEPSDEAGKLIAARVTLLSLAMLVISRKLQG